MEECMYILLYLQLTIPKYTLLELSYIVYCLYSYLWNLLYRELWLPTLCLLQNSFAERPSRK